MGDKRSQVYFARIRNEQHIELDCGTIKRKTLQTMAQSCAVLQQTVNTIFDKEKRKELTYIEEDKPLRKIAGQYNSDADGKVPACGPSSRGNSNSLPTGLRSNVKLKQVVEKLMCNSVTKRPRSTYKQGFETYKLFLSIHDVVFVHPLISQDILVHFVAYCQHNLFLKFSTIRQYLCGIRYMFLDMGIPNPFESKCHSMNRLKLISNAIRKVQYIGKHFLSSAFRQVAMNMFSHRHIALGLQIIRVY